MNNTVSANVKWWTEIICHGIYTQLSSVKFSLLTVGSTALICYWTGSWLFQYSITQEQQSYSTIDDDDCDYDCDDSRGLLTTWFSSLKANLRRLFTQLGHKILTGSPRQVHYTTNRKTAKENNTLKVISYYKKQLLAHTKHIRYYMCLYLWFSLLYI
jgi:hypothetical protein